MTVRKKGKVSAAVKLDLNASNVMTGLVVFYAVVGAALVLLSAVIDVDPALRLSFAAYLERMAIATGAVAIGRGIAKSNTGT